jgi:predicted nucleic acid-binding Zn ribbon protein
MGESGYHGGGPGGVDGTDERGGAAGEDFDEAAETESVAVYQRFRRVFGSAAVRGSNARKRRQKTAGGSVPFAPGRDPDRLGDIVQGLTARLGWDSSLAQSDLMLAWTEIAGEETAAHSRPTGIENGTLTVECESTAWATQLRLMRVQITTRIAEKYPDAGVQSIRFQGPDAPSWKRGPKSIPGRGPRDTYG